MEIVIHLVQAFLNLTPTVFEDDRGYFMESFKKFFLKEKFPSIYFIQDNESKSLFGVLRGLHFQKPPHEQTKLVRVIQGEVLDVAVDLRKNSSTYGRWESTILSGENKKQLLIPKGFAHGFVVKNSEAVFAYKVDNTYDPNFESGIIYNDPTLNVDWEIPSKDLIISEKDLKLKTLI